MIPCQIARSFGGKNDLNGYNFCVNYLIKLKFEFDLYFMIPNNYTKFDEDPSISNKGIIWKT